MIRTQITHNKQQGVVLAVALVMLLITALLAISGMRATTMEERMASNSRNNNIAFQMAETALRDAEAILQAEPESIQIIEAQANSVGLIGCVNTLNSVDFTSQAVWDANACDYMGSADDAVSNPPQYFIEFLYAKPLIDLANPAGRDCFYRITARGYGADSNSHSTLQTTYQFSSCT